MDKLLTFEGFRSWLAGKLPGEMVGDVYCLIVGGLRRDPLHRYLWEQHNGQDVWISESRAAQHLGRNLQAGPHAGGLVLGDRLEALPHWADMFQRRIVVGRDVTDEDRPNPRLSTVTAGEALELLQEIGEEPEGWTPGCGEGGDIRQEFVERR